MSVSLNELLYGIRRVESGGNYHVVNSIGAVGAYQVMKANIPSWTKRALGYSMTWQQFRDSKSAQDAVARSILGGYYKKYGAEGAASMWFSGQPNPNSSASDGGNTVRQYVNKVMSASGGGSIGGGGGGGGSSYSVGTVTPKLNKYELAGKYGLTYATIKANKELYSLFNKAVAGQWDATLFTAKLKNTKWWRTTSDAQRKFFLMRTGDPATYKQKYSGYLFSINKLAVDVGLTSQLGKGNKPTDLLNRAIMYKMRDGWSDARIKAYLGGHVSMHGSEFYGEAGEAYDQVFQLAYANGQTYSKSWYQSHIRDVVSGKTTVEAMQAQIRNAAASKYYAFANQIKAGATVMDLAQPYISAVAQILELPETDIDLKNKYVDKAMTSKVQAGQSGGTQYPIWKFENDLRSDPLWKKTNNARESMFSVAHQVAKDFGMAY